MKMNAVKGLFFSYRVIRKVGLRNCSNLVSQNLKHFDDILKDIIRFKDSDISNWVVEKRIQKLCYKYQILQKEEKEDFLQFLSVKYAVDHQRIYQLSCKISSNEKKDPDWLLSRERDLKNALVPTYNWLFTLMSRLENGVKFLVDLRTDVLELISKTKGSDEVASLQQLNYELRDLLLLWFSVGFLHVERITWQSSCEMLQKISDYEMVHPMRNWTDLKRRVGPYRRCFVYTHPSMPLEPLVVLHVALSDVITDSVKGIKEAEDRIIGEHEEVPLSFLQEDKTKIKTAIFYSIASTQKGLQGIELGNYLIKQAAHLVKGEFPLIDQYSTLSPIPNFRLWFLEKVKQDPLKILNKDEEETMKQLLRSEDLFQSLKKLFSDNLWTKNMELVNALKKPMLRSCAWYLYKEKRRNYALNLVANFHLRNGAVMWRINWMADPSPRGSANSCGIMVNYRYYLENTESNSQDYIEKKKIKTSEEVLKLVNQAERIMCTS